MKFPIKEFTQSAAETEEIGRKLATAISRDDTLPRFVAMYGDLGVGKTAFVRGFCSELCRGAIVKSPTYALVNEYKCPVSTQGIKRVHHFDMYRIADEDDLYSIGFYDYLRQDCICIAEWCELIPYALPESYIRVQIEKADLGDKRNIVISYIGD
jgi:tRNA threonylcarbamoyladenosine biosynthesis protein TsaE